MKKLKIILFAFVLAISACGEDAPSLADDGCPTEIICTEELRILVFTPRQNDSPVILDSYYTQNLDNGETYNFEDALGSGADPGYYVVITDSEFEDIAREGTNLRFFGIKNGQVIIEQDFVAGHDCCHVIPLEGPFDNF